MADGQYRHLTCVGCSVGFTSVVRRGPILNYCGKACRDQARAVRDKGKPHTPYKPRQPQQQTCIECLAPFISRKKMFCSRACRERQKNRKVTAGRRERCEPVKPRPCARCSSPFMPKHAVSMYCSKTCKQTAWAIKHGLQRPDGVQQAMALLRERDRQSALEARDLVRQRAREAREAEREAAMHRVCRRCGAAFVRSSGLFCAASCRDEAKRASRRAERQKRRARTRAAKVETFDPIEVLERDGWRCQICGIKTPRAKRGSYATDAPELDHVVPLAAGGEHSRANTQCACRRCNLKKGAGPPCGQMGLFTSLDVPRGYPTGGKGYSCGETAP